MSKNNRVVIKFDTDNAAFDQDSYCDEVARILRKIAAHVESGSAVAGKWSIIDSNGNKVGTFSGTGEG